MARNAYKLLFVAALVVAGSASRGLAQAPAASPYYSDWSVLQSQLSNPPGAMPMVPSPNPGIAGPSAMPNFETGWPRPPEIPSSLFTEAPTPTPYACAPIPGRYFEMDPLVDPPGFPQPGFVADIELLVVGPKIYQSLSNGVAVGPNPPGTLTVPITPLFWTVSPKVEMGWRLPEGFGAIMVNYQYLGTTGTGSTPFGPNGPASMTGRLNFNMSDIDYVSREFTPWEHWGMQWRFGFRQLYLFYDTDLNTPFAAAAAGNGIVQQAGTNGYRGWGGHLGLEMDREFNRQLPGLSFVGKFDFGDTAGFVQQRISQTTTAGAYYSGSIQNGQDVPMVTGQAGLSYRPLDNRYEIYAGAFYQYIWNVGTLSNFALNTTGASKSGGELSLTGVTIRFSFNY